MISYNELYEILRKEKYSENLQLLPGKFVEGVAEYLNEKRSQLIQEDDMFEDSIIRSKKQLENSIAIFKELILRRKKKLLNLVFIAAETGIMKRDFDNMLAFEKDIFEKLVKALEEGDKELTRLINSKKIDDKNKMILFTQDVEQFVDMSGNTVGPFSSGSLANLENNVSDILVSAGKAQLVDQ